MYTITWPYDESEGISNLSEFGIVKPGQWIPRNAEYGHDPSETYFLVLETEEEAALWILSNRDPNNRLAILTDNLEVNSGWKEVGFDLPTDTEA